MRAGLAFLLVLGIAVAHAQPAPAQTPPSGSGLGVGVADLPAGMPVRGAWVRQVLPGSAASAAGLQANDVVIALDGRKIPDAAGLVAAVRQAPPGTHLRLQVLRPTNGTAVPLALEATLGGAPAPPAPPSPVAGAQPPLVSPAPVQWTRFTDPREQAFSVEVPKGWRVTGGLTRRSAATYAPFVRALSPDGATYLLFGDPNLIGFATPVVSPWALQRPEGSRIVAPSGDPLTVARYQPGATFAATYARQDIGRFCQDVQVGQATARPDLASGSVAAINPAAHHDAGAVGFTCTHGGKPARGEVAALTHIYRSGTSAVPDGWGVDLLVGWIAPPEGAAAAADMAAHMLASLRIDPAWQRRETELTEQVARHVLTMTQDQIRAYDRIAAEQRNRMHDMDRQFEAVDRIITGTSPYVDPSGNVHQLIDNTKRYQWIGPHGETMGTQAPVSPGLGWQPMQEVPPP